MKKLAIIPARGGSKRIPGKNLRLFGGKPMIAHAIQAARQTGIFDAVIVSTDSDEIAQVARSWGADVPFMRPAALADDCTDTATVIVHALTEMQNRGVHAEYFCCIAATAALLDPRHLNTGYEKLAEVDATTAVSVTAYSHPAYRALKLTPPGRLEMIWPEYRLTRTQDLPVTYYDAGQFYWGHSARFLVEKTLFASDCVAIILPRGTVQDIDTVEDWQLAERLFLANKRS